jgi:DNA-binding NarL/FixJ family response regulator
VKSKTDFGPGVIIMQKKIKLLIVCGEMSSCLIISELKKEKDFVVLKEVFNLNDAIRRAKKTKPDILFICAYFLKEKGIDIIAKVKKKIKTKVVIFNGHFTQDQELLLVKEGVVGILNCNLSTHTLGKALSKVNDGELWITRKALSLLVGMPPLAPYNLKFHKKRVAFSARSVEGQKKASPSQ